MSGWTLILALSVFCLERTKPQQFVRLINDLNEGDESNIVDLILKPSSPPASAGFADGSSYPLILSINFMLGGFVMERLLAVVFNDEGKTYEGLRAINQLDAEGSITAYAAQVIKKEPDGSISAKQTDGNFPLQTSKGVLLGSLIGLLGGPVGVGIGAVVGASGRQALPKLNIADVNLDFVQEVADALTPGLNALIVDANEEWVTPVDTRMEALGGVVTRAERQRLKRSSGPKKWQDLRPRLPI